MAGDTVDRIKERVDIVDLIGGRVQLRRAGRNLKGLCPFHQEKTPSFVVFPDSQHYHCFGCGKSGDIFTFVMETENLDFRDAMERLAARAGVEIKRGGQQKKDERREHLIELHEMAAAYFASTLWSKRGEAAQEVLEQRGVDRQTAEEFSLGFAPDSWDSLKNHLHQRANASEDLLVESGLCSRSESGRVYDRFRNRLIFPIRRRDGKVIGFGARAMGDDMPKYLNSPQTPIFNKSMVLYGLDRAYPEIRKTRTLVVVEGYMDAIAAHQFGYLNVVASMGTALTQEQVQSIRRYVDRVYIALDSDAAGQLATLRAIDTVRDAFGDDQAPTVDSRQMIRFERALSAEIRIVLLEEGKDPDELIRHDRAAWDASVERSVALVEYVLRQRLSSVEDSPAARANALNEYAAPVLREVTDPAIQSEYIDLTARLLGYSERDVRSALSRRRSSGPRKTVEVRSTERPRAANPEETLMALLLSYPLAYAARQGTLYQIRPEAILDARRRQIIEEILLNEGDRDSALANLSEELQEYAREIQATTLQRAEMSPGMANIEITQAIESLERTRYLEHMAQVRADIEEAKESGDQESLRLSLQRLTELAARKPSYAPRESPYFRDTRTVGR